MLRLHKSRPCVFLPKQHHPPMNLTMKKIMKRKKKKHLTSCYNPQQNINVQCKLRKPWWWSPYLFLALGHFFFFKKRTKKQNKLTRATLLKEGNCACALCRCTCGKKKHITQTFFGINV